MLFSLQNDGSPSVTVCILVHKVKARRKEKQLQQFFKQNHGQLLQQLVSEMTDVTYYIFTECYKSKNGDFQKIFVWKY